MLSVVAFVFVLGVVIFVHELGHFVTAKIAGVKVQEFGIGYPPRLFAVRRGETEYSLNLVPLGGFVRLLGQEDPSEPDGLASKGIVTRLIVLSAGSIMNVLLPIALFSLIFLMPTETIVGQVQILEVAPDSPAELAGIEPGDIILQINDRTIEHTYDAVYAIRLNLGSEVTMLIEKDQTPRIVKALARWNPPEGQGSIGIVMSMTNTNLVTRAYPIWEAIPLGIRSSLETLTLLRNEVLGWFIGGKLPQITGPVGIAQMTGEVAKTGLMPLLGFTALLSMNLAVLNLLPIPMLDGGRIVFVILEGLRRGERVQPKLERLIHLIGLMLLITLIVVVSYFDALRIIRGESLWQ